MAVAHGLQSLTKELAEVFLEDSENDQTFYGFSEEELSDQDKKISDDEAAENKPSKETKPAQTFRLRVALRSRVKHQSFSQESTEEEEEKPPITNKVTKRSAEVTKREPNVTKRSAEVTKRSVKVKKERHVEFEDAAVMSALKGDGSGEEEEETFLAKREQNIRANKAMLAKLMADLQKMPGGAGILKKQVKRQKTLKPPRSAGDMRMNPERASRRRTRSMGGASNPQEEQGEELELTLEEELMGVRRAPQRRCPPRPAQSKPHVVRAVDDITEAELELIADNMTEKVYNRVTGSTCHQCRQKTVDTKTCCRNEGCRGIQGQFCGPCLRNRYGEDVRSALLDPEWQCPPCRNICNCSFCRAREGRCPTGILYPLAQYHGFSDVHSYLTSLRIKVKHEEDGDQV